MRTETPAEHGEAVGVPVKKALFCSAVFFILMLFFNGVAMFESAGLLEYGRVRDFWMSVLRPVELASRSSGLYLVRSRTQETVGGWLNNTEKRR